MKTYSTLSVIVPTYNRSDSLIRLLECLDRQSYPPMYWEVIVIDDGSSDPGYSDVYSGKYKFKFLCIQQNHQGAVAARNLGAQNSKADVLVFLDDDVTVEPGYLEGLAREHYLKDRAIIMGLFRPSKLGPAGTFKTAVLRFGVTQIDQTVSYKVDFTYCVSHNLSIKRRHFYEIGKFQDPTEQQGWAAWDDIDLAYRAYQNGFEFVQVGDALGSHIDHVLDDFKAYCDRVYLVGRNAHWLFHKYPELQYLLPMFQDKNPIRIGKDPIRLIIRKVLRSILAWKPVLNLMEILRRFLERHLPDSILLAQLYRWINSSYIFRGFRFGLTRQ